MYTTVMMGACVAQVTVSSTALHLHASHPSCVAISNIKIAVYKRQQRSQTSKVVIDGDDGSAPETSVCGISVSPAWPDVPVYGSQIDAHGWLQCKSSIELLI